MNTGEFTGSGSKPLRYCAVTRAWYDPSAIGFPLSSFPSNVIDDGGLSDPLNVRYVFPSVPVTATAHATSLFPVFLAASGTGTVTSNEIVSSVPSLLGEK